MNSKIRLLLVDDHAVVRQGLRALLEAEPDMEVVGEAENGRQAVVAAEKAGPDVVLMDVVMPGLNGVEATRQLLQAVPSAKVLVLSSYGDEASVREMLRVGAAGYLIKQAAADDLSEAIRQVKRGNAFYTPAIARRLREQARGRAIGGGRLRRGPEELTEREAQVLQLIAQGRANKQIAAELGISIKTVEKHRQKVMDKLHIHDIAGLTRYAVSQGVVEGKRAAAV